jgi:hypothetical protein
VLSVFRSEETSSSFNLVTRETSSVSTPTSIVGNKVQEVELLSTKLDCLLSLSISTIFFFIFDTDFCVPPRIGRLLLDSIEAHFIVKHLQLLSKADIIPGKHSSLISQIAEYSSAVLMHLLNLYSSQDEVVSGGQHFCCYLVCFFHHGYL